MNWILDIICIAIITLTIAFAVRNGFVKTLVSAASFLIAVFITFCFASQLSDALRSTPVADRIRESTREKIEDLVLESTGSGESLLNGENEAFNTLLGLAGYSIDTPQAAVLRAAEGNPLAPIDFWSVDTDYDGKVFRHDRDAAVYRDKKGLCTKMNLEIPAQSSANRKIAVRAADIFGNISYAIIDGGKIFEQDR